MPTSFTRCNPSPHSSEPHRFSPDKAQAHYVWHLSCTSNIYHLRQWFSSLPNSLMSPILHNLCYNVHSVYVSIIISTADTGWIFAPLSCGIMTNTCWPQPDHAAAGLHTSAKQASVWDWRVTDECTEPSLLCTTVWPGSFSLGSTAWARPELTGNH